MSDASRPDARDRRVVAVAYLAALTTAAAVVWLLGGAHPLWQVAMADVAATVTVFAFSLRYDNHSLYDPYWSVAPMIIAAWLVVGAGSDAVAGRQLVVTAVIVVWGIRLTFNWWRQWRGLSHEDWRYQDLRGTSGSRFWAVSLAGIHLFPTVLVYGGCLSLYVSLHAGSRPLSWLDAVGVAVASLGIWFEAAADRQLHHFVRQRTRPGAILDTGLWGRCRHPNYFGEIVFWWGLSLLGLAADPQAVWILVGPLGITLLFLFISLPMIERRMAQRHPGWAEHAARVPLILPRGRRRTRA